MFAAVAACNMAAGPADETDKTANPIQFIDENPASEKDAKHKRRLVRSHVSKLNRRRAKGHGTQQLEWTTEVLRPGVSGIRKSAIFGGLQDNNEIDSPTTSADTLDKTYQQVSCDASSDDSEADVQVLNLRTISPFLGALRTGAFTYATPVDESAHYFLRIILPNAFLPTQAWFKMFCEEPLVFHGFSAACNLHLAMADTYSARVKRQRLLLHKNEAIRLINDKLSHLTYVDIEPVMLGMFTIYPEDEEVRRAVGRGKTAFVPHMPWADDMDIYVGGNPDTHRNAIAWLVDQAGGILKLNLPGLAKATATNDLILASMSGSKPYFPWLWPVDPFILLESSEFLTFGNAPCPSESGFAELGIHLAAQARYCFYSLSCIDLLMAETRRRRLSDSEAKILITSRNTVHHRLLSMAAQDIFDGTESARFSAAVYECCRLTCLVYCQCVVFPVPSWTAGLRGPLAELRNILKLLAAGSAHQDLWPVMLWASLVGSVAVLHTPLRSVFMKTLKDVSTKLQAQSLYDILAIARNFVWSDSAGEQGAAIVCELCGIETYPP